MRKLFFVHAAGLVVLTLVAVSCAGGSRAEDATLAPSGPGEESPARFVPEAARNFSDYWYQGLAEVTSYRLEQARYGEIHQGQAVLVFVTEDFSRSKQVKLDRPATAGLDAVPVLKLNATRKFFTGVYPYSMMTSVFSPVGDVEDDRALKVTTSSQEWCGHSFTQLNRTSEGYLLDQKSYFESEGDEEAQLSSVLLEDDLWVRVRTRPQELPVGDLKLIPATVFHRLRHLPWRAFAARASLALDPADSTLSVYRIEYQSLPRAVAIHFETAFPHRIHSWEEQSVSGRGSSDEALVTRAVLLRSLKTDYWNRHRLEDAPLRDQLGLDSF